MEISNLVRKGPTMRMGREVPHAGGGEEPHGGGESHIEVVEKATRRWKKNPHDFM